MAKTMKKLHYSNPHGDLRITEIVDSHHTSHTTRFCCKASTWGILDLFGRDKESSSATASPDQVWLRVCIKGCWSITLLMI